MKHVASVGKPRKRLIFSFLQRNEALYIYSDESGVFDSANNDVFVYGGIIFLSEEERDNARRRYVTIEKQIRDRIGHPDRNKAPRELKATTVQNKYKAKLFKASNNYVRFGVVVHERFLLKEIFENKKSKQRYLDWAFKMGIRAVLQRLGRENKIDLNTVSELHFYQDEHSTATNGRYELRESLEQEFKIGTYNARWDTYHPPLFSHLERVCLKLCDSSSSPLIRASDIVANKIFCFVRDCHLAELTDTIYIKELP